MDRRWKHWQHPVSEDDGLLPDEVLHAQCPAEAPDSRAVVANADHDDDAEGADMRVDESDDAESSDAGSSTSSSSSSTD